MKILLLNIIFWAYAQVPPVQTPPVQTPPDQVISFGKIKNEMKKLRSLKPSNFIREIDSYRELVEKFIDHKKRVCNGEFSKMILGEDSGKEQRTLSKEEKNSCFEELLNLHMAYIDNLFMARSRFLAHQHDERMKNLKTAKEKSIQSIKNKFSKKGKKKKRR